MQSKTISFVGMFFLVVVSLWSQITDLSIASQAVGRNRWITALNAQVLAMQSSAEIFLAKVKDVFPLPKGMTNLEMTNTYYITLAGDFSDYEYQLKTRLSNENYLITLTWSYSSSLNERAYNFVQSLPFLSQSSVWWKAVTNRGTVITIWREKEVYSYLRVIEEKDNTLIKGFLIKIEIIPIKKISSQAIEGFIWEYITTSDWTSMERLLR